MKLASKLVVRKTEGTVSVLLKEGLEIILIYTCKSRKKCCFWARQWVLRINQFGIIEHFPKGTSVRG